MKLTLLLFSFIACTAIVASLITITQFIKIDQFGYMNNDQEIAVISNPQVGYNAALSFTPGNKNQIRNLKSYAVAFSGSPVDWNSGVAHDKSGNIVLRFDFAHGFYFIQLKKLSTKTQKFGKQ